ncbi:hypothetical protein EVAR_102600_1 [Eumeta japonica]|uniref:Uncharacterized protein n=1 Tax=Eumeta variegata TaxID=151549 RepID=A0A4C1TUP5_EUMVA|nr:hypothetical protein EVAR_102600_1 [Eumeta japonica]
MPTLFKKNQKEKSHKNMETLYTTTTVLSEARADVIPKTIHENPKLVGTDDTTYVTYQKAAILNTCRTVKKFPHIKGSAAALRESQKEVGRGQRDRNVPKTHSTPSRRRDAPAPAARHGADGVRGSRTASGVAPLTCFWTFASVTTERSEPHDIGRRDTTYVDVLRPDCVAARAPANERSGPTVGSERSLLISKANVPDDVMPYSIIDKRHSIAQSADGRGVKKRVTSIHQGLRFTSHAHAHSRTPRTALGPERIVGASEPSVTDGRRRVNTGAYARLGFPLESRAHSAGLRHGARPTDEFDAVRSSVHSGKIEGGPDYKDLFARVKFYFWCDPPVKKPTSSSGITKIDTVLQTRTVREDLRIDSSTTHNIGAQTALKRRIRDCGAIAGRPRRRAAAPDTFPATESKTFNRTSILLDGSVMPNTAVAERATRHRRRRVPPIGQCVCCIPLNSDAIRFNGIPRRAPFRLLLSIERRLSRCATHRVHYCTRCVYEAGGGPVVGPSLASRKQPTAASISNANGTRCGFRRHRSRLICPERCRAVSCRTKKKESVTARAQTRVALHGEYSAHEGEKRIAHHSYVVLKTIILPCYAVVGSVGKRSAPPAAGGCDSVEFAV